MEIVVDTSKITTFTVDDYIKFFNPMYDVNITHNENDLINKHLFNDVYISIQKLLAKINVDCKHKLEDVNAFIDIINEVLFDKVDFSSNRELITKLFNLISIIINAFDNGDKIIEIEDGDGVSINIDLKVDNYIKFKLLIYNQPKFVNIKFNNRQELIYILTNYSLKKYIYVSH